MLNKLETLSVAEWRRAEAIKIAIMGRKGLDMKSDELDGHGSDFDRVMKDAEYIENWIELANVKARMAAEVDEQVGGGFLAYADTGTGGLTHAQIQYLRETLPSAAGCGAFRLIREFYRMVALENKLWPLPLAADLSEPDVDRLAVDDDGFVVRYDGGQWESVVEYPGYRLVPGAGDHPAIVYWAPGVWPPVTEEAAEPFRSGDVNQTGDQLAASGDASVEGGVA